MNKKKQNQHKQKNPDFIQEQKLAKTNENTKKKPKNKEDQKEIEDIMKEENIKSLENVR